MKDTHAALPSDGIHDQGLQDGIWSILVKGEIRPDLVATHRGTPVPDLSWTRTDGGWQAAIALPVTMLGDGVQTIVLAAPDDGIPLASLSVASGAALSQDLAAEVALLRAELDLLKRAFRTHCADTAS